jgi:hypothetical protein
VRDYLDPEHSVVAVAGSGHRMNAACEWVLLTGYGACRPLLESTRALTPFLARRRDETFARKCIGRRTKVRMKNVSVARAGDSALLDPVVRRQLNP